MATKLTDEARQLSGMLQQSDELIAKLCDRLGDGRLPDEMRAEAEQLLDMCTVTRGRVVRLLAAHA